MKRTVLPAAIGLAAVFAASCSFDFGNDGKDITPSDPSSWESVSSRYTGTAGEAPVDVEVTKWYCDDVLSYVTEDYVNDDGLVYQRQRYDGSGSLEWVEAYAYGNDPEWRLLSVSRWDGAASGASPKTLKTFGYDGAGTPVTEASFTLSGTAAAVSAAGTPLWCTRFALTEAASAPVYRGAVWTEASLGSSGTADDKPAAFFARLWLPGKDSDTDHWNFSAEYRLAENYGVPAAPVPKVTEPKTALSAALDVAAAVAAVKAAAAETNPELTDEEALASLFHGALELASPTEPAFTVPVLPDPASPGIAPYRFGMYASETEGSSTELSFDGEWYPLSVTRTDSSLPAPVKIEASWDDDRRLVSKKTWVGGTLALSVDIEWDGAGYPLTVSTGGEGLALPLDYGFVYAAGSHTLQEITFGAEGIGTLQSLRFKTSGTLGVDLPPVEDLRSVDPFAFMKGILTDSLTVEHWDGNTPQRLVEYFTLDADAAGVTATVHDAKLTEDQGDDEITGSYEALWTAGGEAVASLSARDADGPGGEPGAVIWSASYAYGDEILQAVEDAVPAGLVPAGLDAASRLSALYEDAASADEASLARSIVQGFVYDLLF